MRVARVGQHRRVRPELRLRKCIRLTSGHTEVRYWVIGRIQAVEVSLLEASEGRLRTRGITSASIKGLDRPPLLFALNNASSSADEHFLEFLRHPQIGWCEIGCNGRLSFRICRG